MERSPVVSSNVQAVGYDSTLMVLEVEFNNGRVYQYLDVPQSEYDALLGASSIGSYLHHNIKNRYQCVQI